MKPITLPLLFLALAWTPACDGDSADNDADTAVPENSAELCADGLDNDNDGAVDCDDLDCRDFEACNREPVFHVFLLLGQSNMVGYPQPLQEDREEDERIRVLGIDRCSRTGREKDEWAVATPPLHNCGQGLGPGDYFAKTLIEALPEGDTIGLVPCAINGEKIETFMKEGGSKYDWIVARARLAQDSGGVISGILFHQGESNNGQSRWPENVHTLVADLKADLGLDDIPFLAGELLYTGSCAGHNRLIEKLPDTIPNAYVVSADGLEVDATDSEWELHFGRDAQVAFGKRYAAIMIDALGLPAK